MSSSSLSPLPQHATRPATSADFVSGQNANAHLTIDLPAIRENYQRLRQQLNGLPCAAVVKADAYGLGLERVGPVLAQAGAETFFTAHLGEALSLRRVLPEQQIFVLGGLMAGAEEEHLAHGICPVLNSLEEIRRYSQLAKTRNQPLRAALQLDSGMSRLGLPPKELELLLDDPTALDGVAVDIVMSHLACADEPDHPLNQQQLNSFRKARARLPFGRASFANSSGIFLGSEYHFDLGRPGVALYGGNPTPDAPNPMRQVVRLQGKILQVREIDAGQCVGYGAAFISQRPSRIATVGVGYADGYLRSLSNQGQAWFETTPLPLAGRVSMDLITLDVTDLPPAQARPGTFVDLLGPNEGVDDVAAKAGTIGYEILTSLGQRYHRLYLDDQA
ncbi:alanine racemase [Rhodovibrionaceae bacterium A322]